MHPIDPYLTSEFDAIESARQSGAKSVFADSPSRGTPGLPVLIRVRRPDVELQHLPGFEERLRTGSIVAGRATAESLRALARDPDVLSVEASRPGDEVPLDCDVSIAYVNGRAVQAPPTLEMGDRAWVGIIDGGIDVKHEAFLDNNGVTRIRYVWDQRDPTGPAPAGHAFGTLYNPNDIQDMVNGTKPVPARLAAANNSSRHGTHVASIAAGRKVSVPNKFAGGMAPGAGIIVVIPDMAVRPMDPVSLGYSISHLAALKFIRTIAEEHHFPVVVNLSQGMNAGAHDGTSALEAGFDNECEGGRLPGYVIVKSAGNERRWNLHAKLVVGPNSSDQLMWKSNSASRPADRMELWFKASDDLEFMLVNPAGELSPPAGRNSPIVKSAFASGDKYELTYVRYHHDNGDSRVTVTVRSDVPGVISPGEWKLKVVARTVQSAGHVHAWIERDNKRGIEFTKHLSEEMTLSIPGTASSVITVSSISGGTAPGVSEFSCYGPTRDGREKPDVAAPGEKIKAAQFGSVNDIVALSGTSMATPHVTGAIALLLSSRQKQCDADKTGATHQLNAAQVRAALTQHAQHFSGFHTFGRGFGILDAKSLIDAFV